MNARRSRTSRGVLLLMALSAAGCGMQVEPDASGEARALTIDEEFTRLSRRVPGFGGYYYDSAGALNVVLTQPTHQLAAVRALLSARGVRGSDTLLARQGRYDFEDLNRWRGRLEAEPLAGLVFTDVDEVNNRITLGMTHPDPEQVAAAMARLLIPADAVHLEQAAPNEQHQTAFTSVHQQNRPLAAGQQIKRFSNGYIYFCTLGFNVRRNGSLGFFTNTHCTNEGTVHYQGSPRIGVTTEDPLFWSNASVVYDGVTYTCSGTNVCRFSDAAYVEYDAGVQSSVKHGYIYRTEVENAYTGGPPSGIAPLKIDEAQPFFRIVGKAYHVAVGEKIHKVGQRTGWTSGLVTHSCVNTLNGSTRLFCQMKGGGAGYDGDSGSPVFRRVADSEQDVELVGIYWGSAMSPIGSIEQDFGPLDVAADSASTP